MELSLKGKIVLVMGLIVGIGKVIVLLLVVEGVIVLINGWWEEKVYEIIIDI